MKVWGFIITFLFVLRCVWSEDSTKVAAGVNEYSQEQKARIAKNKQIAQILTDVDREFKKKKRLQQKKLSAAEQKKNQQSLMKKAKGSYGLFVNKWSKFRFGSGENKHQIPLPKYLDNLEHLVKNMGNDEVLIQQIDVTTAESHDEYHYEDYEYTEADFADDDCEKNLIKKFIKEKCKALDRKQQETLQELVEIVNAINGGSVHAVHALVNCLGAIEEDLFDIFKEILVIIDKLIQIGVDAVKLILEIIIDIIGDVIKGWEEKNCGCDCPGLLHSILKWLIDLITWTPQKLLAQLIQHIIDTILSLPLPRCTCACEGIFATDFDVNNVQDLTFYYEADSNFTKRDDVLIDNVTEFELLDDEIAQSNLEFDDLESTNAVQIQKLPKKKRKSNAIHETRVESPVLKKIDQILSKQVERKNSRQQAKEEKQSSKEGIQLDNKKQQQMELNKYHPIKNQRRPTKYNEQEEDQIDQNYDDINDYSFTPELQRQQGKYKNKQSSGGGYYPKPKEAVKQLPNYKHEPVRQSPNYENEPIGFGRKSAPTYEFEPSPPEDNRKLTTGRKTRPTGVRGKRSRT